MRSKWYGDKRDLVKWGVLCQLAKEHAAKLILQIPFLCKKHEQWNEELIIGNNSYGIPSEVRSHFRNIYSIKNLQITAGTRIEVFPEEYWDTDRSGYLCAVEAFIRRSACNEPIVVLLDPDTGFAKKGRRNSPKHVTEDDVTLFWEKSLRPKDILVIYQHHPHRKDWQDDKQNELRRILPEPILVARSPNIASDVVFFYCVKG